MIRALQRAIDRRRKFATRLARQREAQRDIEARLRAVEMRMKNMGHTR